MKNALLKTLVLAVTVMFLSTVAVAAEKKSATEKKDDKKVELKKDEKTAKSALIDINTATEQELKTIDGIGDAYSKKIIEGRPYARKDQLKSKKIIPGELYEKIKEKIIAKQPKKK